MGNAGIILMPVGNSATVYNNGVNVFAIDNIGRLLKIGTFGIDDTLVIQTALNVTGSIYIDKGVYNITSALKIPSNTFVKGAGKGATILRNVTGANIMIIQNSAYDGTFTSSNSNIGLYDLEIDSNGGNNAVYFGYVLDLTVERIYVHDSKPSAITFEQCKPLYVHSVRGGSTRTPNSSGQGIVVLGVKDAVFVNCIADKNNGLSGWDFETSGVTVIDGLADSKDVLVVNCISRQNVGQGWTVSNVISCDFVNCTALLNQQDGFNFNSGNYTGCRSYDNSQQTTNTYSAYHFIGNAYNRLVEGCYDSGTSHKYSYLCDSGTSHNKILSSHSYSVGTANFQDNSTGGTNRYVIWNNINLEINKNNSDSASITIPNVDTAVQTYTLAANSYENIITECDIEITTSGTSILQALTVKVKYATTVIKTYNAQITTATVNKINLHLKCFGPFKAGGNITITVMGASADANTSILTHNLFVNGSYN